MTGMIKVKVCGMRDPENAGKISLTGPDFMGFIFYRGSARYIGDEPDLSLFGNIGRDIKKVGIFADEDRNRITDMAYLAGLDLVQLHGSETPLYCSALRSSGLTVIKSFGITGRFGFSILKDYESACDYFLFDSGTGQSGGSGQKFGWDILERLDTGKPFFIGGGVGPGDTAKIKALENTGLYAVDINSRFETSPGIKDESLVREFINELKYR